MAAYVAEMKKVAQKVTAAAGLRAAPPSGPLHGSARRPQIIDTVRPDETTQEMFRYFEPLYEVIRDMPRPPDAFFRRAGGEWCRAPARSPRPAAAAPGAVPPRSARLALRAHGRLFGPSFPSPELGGEKRSFGFPEPHTQPYLAAGLCSSCSARRGHSARRGGCTPSGSRNVNTRLCAERRGWGGAVGVGRCWGGLAVGKKPFSVAAGRRLHQVCSR